MQMLATSIAVMRAVLHRLRTAALHGAAADLARRGTGHRRVCSHAEPSPAVDLSSLRAAAGSSCGTESEACEFAVGTASDVCCTRIDELLGPFAFFSPP